MSTKTNSALSELGRRTSAPPISWLMRIKLERPKLVSLAAGFTDNESLPLAGSRRLMNELLRDRALGQAALQYGSNAGDGALIERTAGRIAELDGAPACQATGLSKRLVITHGSQQFLYLLTEALCDPGEQHCRTTPARQTEKLRDSDHSQQHRGASRLPP